MSYQDLIDKFSQLNCKLLSTEDEIKKLQDERE